MRSHVRLMRMDAERAVVYHYDGSVVCSCAPFVKYRHALAYAKKLAAQLKLDVVEGERKQPRA